MEVNQFYLEWTKVFIHRLSIPLDPWLKESPPVITQKNQTSRTMPCGRQVPMKNNLSEWMHRGQSIRVDEYLMDIRVV